MSPSAPKPPRVPFDPRVSERLRSVAPSASEAAADLVLEDAEWRDLALGGERLEFAEISQSRLAQGDLSDTDLYRCSLVDVRAESLDLANALFTESLLRRVRLEQCRLTGVGLAACMLEDVTFSHCVVDLANLRFAKFTRVLFDGCQLTGAELINAELTDVRFRDCDLAEVQFAQARCQRVAITGSRLDGVRGVDGLRGATIAPVDLISLTHQLAAALGITVADD